MDRRARPPAPDAPLPTVPAPDSGQPLAGEDAADDDALALPVMTFVEWCGHQQEVVVVPDGD